METTKKNRGGYREGAGRKRIGTDRRQTLAVRVAPETLEKLEQMAKDQRKSKGLLIDELIKLL